MTIVSVHHDDENTYLVAHDNINDDRQANGYASDDGDDDPYIVFGYGSLIFRVRSFPKISPLAHSNAALDALDARMHFSPHLTSSKIVRILRSLLLGRQLSAPTDRSPSFSLFLDTIRLFFSVCLTPQSGLMILGSLYS